MFGLDRKGKYLLETLPFDVYNELKGYENWARQSDIANDAPLVFTRETLMRMIEDSEQFGLSVESKEYLEHLVYKENEVDLFFFNS